MVGNMQGRWVVAAATFAAWALVAASCVYWGLKLAGRGDAQAAAPIVRTPPNVDPLAVARLMGYTPVQAAAAPQASLASRFALLGVVAGKGHDGAALIAVDGKPAKPFRVGAPVDEGLVLKSVEPRRAVLAASLDSNAAVTLELPLKR